MNPYTNEDVMWQRLKDIQREVENRRLFAEHTVPSLLRLVGLLGRRAWNLAGLATYRAPRRHALHVDKGEKDAASDAA